MTGSAGARRALHRLWGLDPERSPVTSFTLGIDTPEVVREKARAAAEYRLLKVKLGRDSDRELITAIRSVSSTPLIVDANQGWTDREDACGRSQWLASAGRAPGRAAVRPRSA
jgi:L-alanine-DL-glutamate epimerase-like enolase superfamily enzyme